VAKVNTFRELVAWQKAMEPAKLVYHVTYRMPKEERFGLTNQMRRAAVSIPSNIAEGFGRQSRPDLIKFLRVARGSLNELTTQVQLALDLGMLRDISPVTEMIAEVDRVLQGLIRSLEKKRP
jgi:four helix bundle protein